MRANRTMATPSQPIVPKKRCAIYTRKSTDEGLDQEYNSLEAQRDAGLAFVASQRHEGWVAVGDGYDDGGYSGGNLDRPGLKRLMADIEAGKIDIVVVYKIDRLTRALSDFAKLVDVFDRNGVSFVSVTQQFNTCTSGEMPEPRCDQGLRMSVRCPQPRSKLLFWSRFTWLCAHQRFWWPRGVPARGTLRAPISMRRMW